MRLATPVTAALVVLTVCVAPMAAQQTATPCGTTTDGMANESMDGTTEMMGNESTTTTEWMGDESMNGTTTKVMGDDSMDETTEMMTNESMSNESTTESMASATTTCADGSMGGESMDDTAETSDATTESMGDDSMGDTTAAAEEGSSAFAPGFGVGAALVALAGALYVARGRM